MNSLIKTTSIAILSLGLMTVLLSSCHSSMKCPTYSKTEIVKGTRA